MMRGGASADKGDVLTFRTRSSVQLSALAQAFAFSGVVLGMSFAPVQLKMALHTRGPMHSWGHLYAFLALCVLWMRLLRGNAARGAAVVVLILLGFAIEAAQAHQQVAAFEMQDLLCDGLGVIAGGVIACLRWGVAQQMRARPLLAQEADWKRLRLE